MLTGLSNFKLRLIFVLFFLALVIPSVILSWQAYEQLRWKSFHQYQQLAQSLAQQIDTALVAAIEREEARADTDYTFLVLAGDPRAGFVQRSDLSKFPVQSELPGIIGYFQVDGKGQFSSPILPQQSGQSAAYGIGPEDSVLRGQLEFNVRSILSQNALVDNTRPVAAPKKESQLAGKTDAGAGPPLAGLARGDNSIYDLERDSADSFSDAYSASAPASQAQLGFDRLQSAEEEKLSSKASKKRSVVHDSPRTAKATIAQRKSIDAKKLSKRKKRLERNYSPKQNTLPAASSSPSLNNLALQIDLFESELEPFRFSLLKSGHFVAYRQVFRNNQRVIQGAVLQSAQFLQQGIGEAFSGSPLRQIASLSVAYDDETLQTFHGDRGRYTSGSASMGGELLHTTNLSEPLNSLSLSFRVTHMPAGVDGRFILMIASSLLLVLTLGTWFLYRLSRRQSLLAQQQQDFVSSVSHELKTPLTSIRMYGEILKNGWVSDDKRMQYYDFIYNEAERLSRLIANVLQVSKVSRNALQLELQPVTINELCRLFKSSVESQIAQSDFELNLDVATELQDQCLNVDTDAFVQIIINLVDNAIKYATNAEKKHIDISIATHKSRDIRISIRDYGPGVPKDQLKKIFQLFYRTEDELVRESKGTGIGLALVKELTLAMGAAIEVVNREQGAEFVLRFPVCAA